jgi:hypothetical protein
VFCVELGANMKVFCLMEEKCECLVSNVVTLCTGGGGGEAVVGFHSTPMGMRSENW